eukprot:2971924-Amphidinium_carterae.1
MAKAAKVWKGPQVRPGSPCNCFAKHPDLGESDAQLRQQTVEIRVESTFAAVLRVQADPDIRRSLLGLTPVKDWEAELHSILRLATSHPEDALKAFVGHLEPARVWA